MAVWFNFGLQCNYKSSLKSDCFVHYPYHPREELLYYDSFHSINIKDHLTNEIKKRRLGLRDTL